MYMYIHNIYTMSIAYFILYFRLFSFLTAVWTYNYISKSTSSISQVSYKMPCSILVRIGCKTMKIHLGVRWLFTLFKIEYDSGYIPGFMWKAHALLCFIWSLVLVDFTRMFQGIYSLSGWTSHRKIYLRVEAASFGFRLFQPPWNLQAPRQQCCRDACQIIERYYHHNIQSRGFEISQSLAIRRLTA